MLLCNFLTIVISTENITAEAFWSANYRVWTASCYKSGECFDQSLSIWLYIRQVKGAIFNYTSALGIPYLVYFLLFNIDHFFNSKNFLVTCVLSTWCAIKMGMLWGIMPIKSGISANTTLARPFMDSSVWSKFHLFINPRRACAARVIVLGLLFCPSVCPSVCLLPRFLPLRATRRPKSDTNGFSATLALF